MIVHPKDNVEVLLETRNGIPAGHKVALCMISKGENIIKYGFPIGHATCDILKGEWVHSHNLVTNLSGTQQYEYTPECCHYNTEKFDKTFLGYLRENGKVGIRNEIWIIPTVGCVADLATRLAGEMSQKTRVTVRALSHTLGCSQLGDDHESTRNLLVALAEHPNTSSVLILGLGCENNQISQLRKLINSPRVHFLEAQKVENEYEEALEILTKLSHEAEKQTRTPQPLSKLCVGLKCGGSDGFSGITANPLLGRFSDWLIACGGTAVLTEVPEMFGAEHILMNRCRDSETFKKVVLLINDFKKYYISNNQPVGENPSPGNKAGGITTLEEKSLGCIQKGGSSMVTDVIQYTGQISTAGGLQLLCAPGNDLVASTALVAAGCQIILFTTGRGTPFGTCVPTLKISTNSELAQSKPHWIDFDAGKLLSGTSIDELLQKFINLIIETADGTMSLNEKNHQSTIAIWKNGVTL